MPINRWLSKVPLHPMRSRCHWRFCTIHDCAYYARLFATSVSVSSADAEKKQSSDSGVIAGAVIGTLIALLSAPSRSSSSYVAVTAAAHHRRLTIAITTHHHHCSNPSRVPDLGSACLTVNQSQTPPSRRSSSPFIRFRPPQHWEIILAAGGDAGSQRRYSMPRPIRAPQPQPHLHPRRKLKPAPAANDRSSSTNAPMVNRAFFRVLSLWRRIIRRRCAVAARE
ncbi:hypothetical protein EI94DRAFT_1828914, partial [Lactarius quietus]